MAQETRIFGPPGTGKTHLLSTQIVPDLVKKYGSDKVLLTSFTKTAAKELSTRIPDIDPMNINTVHAICYHILNWPKMINSSKIVDEWNKTYPEYKLSVGISGVSGVEFNDYQLLMNRMIEETAWPPHIKLFKERWCDFKEKTKTKDFIDLIVEASISSFGAPNGVEAIVVDEAQDTSSLLMHLIRQWSLFVKELILVGDEDQCIHVFNGSNPSNMLEPPIPDNQKKFLTQSYRIPKKVHTIAESIIKRVKVREEKHYQPKSDEGKIIYGSGNFQNPEWMIKQINAQPDKTHMIMASCSYMLKPTILELKGQSLAYSNPWNRSRIEWNITNSSGSELLKLFIDSGPDKPYWDTNQFISFAKHLKTGPEGLIRKQGKAGIKALEEHLKKGTQGLHTSREYLADILSKDAIQPALDRDLDWLMGNLTAVKKKMIEYPAKLYKQKGPQTLLSDPNIFIVTIHSFKGAQAQNVYLFPDISWASAKASSEDYSEYENLCRLFYTGVTRTEETLYIFESATKHYFSI